ncbi:hypothetical protein AC578_8629 [Pseudocercospora eumusae]|uniref:TOG domain-containing protein n=1 Tax=Pseudocercospora eumusae TaxID=321146 RepID=A0A139HQD2_9PEZI|nr:hypothetical protein AC578_8629 [Pseudocercospora eumusae]
MEQAAVNLLSTLKRPAAPSEAKINALNALKSDIKHYRVPESAQATVFECIKLAITQQASSTLTSTALSTLGHLLKRLKIQDSTGHAITTFAPRLFPALQDRLGDLRESVRTATAQALCDLYPFLTSDVEQMVREEAIGGSNARAKDAGMRWVVKMHKEEGMPFKSYTQALVARLEDADGTVREAAKAVVIELFSEAPAPAKKDLQRQLKAFNVRHSIASQILAAIGSESSGSRPQTAANPQPSPQMTASTRSLPTVDHAALLAESINSDAAKPPPQEIVPMDPIYVDSRAELDDIFQDMRAHFEGKETEHNWMPRDKSITKLRRILKGNAPNEYHHNFMAGIKSLVEGIIKVSNSLRTTMSTNGCQLVQELAKTLGPALDPHVEIFLQTFIKMSAATKHIAAENGKTTSNEIFQNCSYNIQMMRHIWLAAQEKNVQQRQCAPIWLTTVLKRQSSYKSSFESSGGLELAEKSIKKGLDDANPKVKEATRATYWTFAKTWPEKAQKIMNDLDPKSKSALEKDPNNPNAALHASVSTASTSSRAGGTASRTALRDMMAEKRKAAGKLPSRPNSAMADLSPAKQRPTPMSNGTSRGPSNLSKVTNRHVSTTSNASTAETAEPSTGAKKGSSLMSGPVRRPRRPEVARPQTADPYASRRLLRPVTPASNGSPIGSPERGTGASKASTAAASSVARNRAKTSEHTAGNSARGSPVRSPVLSRDHIQPAASSRPTSKGSETMNSIREDDLTMVMPKGVTANRGHFSPGHKRPGLGETRSVDSGIPAMNDDEGFTMVMPHLPHQPRAPSPLAYRSPIKDMFAEARMKGKLSPEAQRLVSHSRSASQEEEASGDVPQGGPVKSIDEVQVYEDPFTENTTQNGADDDRKVLGELPVNENNRPRSPTQSVGSISNSPGSPRQAEPARAPPAASSQDRAEVMRNRRLLSSGIERIRNKTLDAHGFRRVQDLAKSKTDIWDGGKTFDELMTVLLDYLQTFAQDPKLSQLAASKIAGLKAQALGVVRALLTLYPKYATSWYDKALVAVLSTREGIDDNSHLITDMRRTADEIVDKAAPERCIDAVLNVLPESSEGTSKSVAMDILILQRLVSRSKESGLDVGSERRARLAQTAARFLNDANSEVRKVDVDFASELFDIFEASKATFWSEFKGADEGRLGLLTYYIAKKGKDTGQ